LRRFHEATQRNAPEVVIWGSGTPKREFLHVDDMAAACLHVLNLDTDAYQANTQPMCSHINVGTGTDVTIRELAETIARVTGYQGELRFDPSKPDGAPRKLLDVSRLTALGWRAHYHLESGLRQTYHWFCDNLDAFRR
ncbi:NAD-dependent epimerase/dehydratase family protein, partial [Thiorhodococcus minor]